MGENLSVYEAANSRLRERYVSVSTGSLAEIVAEHRDARPAAIAHWLAGEAEYRLVEGGLAREEAYDFAERYGELLRSSGWATMVDLPKRYPDAP